MELFRKSNESLRRYKRKSNALISKSVSKVGNAIRKIILELEENASEKKQ